MIPGTSCVTKASSRRPARGARRATKSPTPRTATKSPMIGAARRSFEAGTEVNPGRPSPGGRAPRGDDGQHQGRRPFGVVEHDLPRLDRPGPSQVGLARVEVPVEPGEVAARDVESDPVP